MDYTTVIAKMDDNYNNQMKVMRELISVQRRVLELEIKLSELKGEKRDLLKYAMWGDHVPRPWEGGA